jgi:hypothetical protein
MCCALKAQRASADPDPILTVWLRSLLPPDATEFLNDPWVELRDMVKTELWNKMMANNHGTEPFASGTTLLNSSAAGRTCAVTILYARSVPATVFGAFVAQVARLKSCSPAVLTPGSVATPDCCP